MNRVGRYVHLEGMAPLLVQVELTEACNLRCRFCYNSRQPRYNTKALEILKTLADQGVMQIALTGGEPLLHPQFFAILSRAEELFANVMILSNGTLMDEEIVAGLHEHRIASVSISVHGDPDTHDELTGVEGSHTRAVRAIREFIVRDQIPVASNFVLNALNAHQLGETVDFLKQIGLRFMTVTRFIPTGVGKAASELIPSREQIVEAFRLIHEHRQKRRRPHIEFAEATPFCALPSDLRYLANTCSYGYDRFYVDVHGELLVCGLSRIRVGGNVLDVPICIIKKASGVFRSFLQDEHAAEECRVCGYFDQCRGGCRAAAMYGSGDWRATRDYLARCTLDQRCLPPGGQ